MWFDDFSNKQSETIQSCRMKAVDLRDIENIEQVNWSKVQDGGINYPDFNSTYMIQLLYI